MSVHNFHKVDLITILMRGQKMKTNKALWAGGFVLLLIAAVIAPTVVSSAAKAPVSNYQITTNPNYDRNPSVFQAEDGSYWLFFTRARDGGGAGRRWFRS